MKRFVIQATIFLLLSGYSLSGQTTQNSHYTGREIRLIIGNVKTVNYSDGTMFELLGI